MTDGAENKRVSFDVRLCFADEADKFELANGAGLFGLVHGGKSGARQACAGVVVVRVQHLYRSGKEQQHGENQRQERYLQFLLHVCVLPFSSSVKVEKQRCVLIVLAAKKTYSRSWNEVLRFALPISWRQMP